MIYNWIFAILAIAFGIWYFTSFNNRSKQKKQEEDSLRKKDDQLPAKKEMYEEAEEKI